MTEETEIHQPTLWQLFKATFLLSAFTFGGGYVIISLMKEQFVDKEHWIKEDEMLDLVAIAQSAPGVMAVNGAIVMGYKFHRYKGILTTVLATVLPPFLIISLIYFFYAAFKANYWINLMLSGMQAGVAAVIASVVYDMGKNVVKLKSWLLIAIMILAFILNAILGISVVYIILGTALLGLLLAFLKNKGVLA